MKWTGAYSDIYGLECGVSQGGLSSPHLFNIYINKLTEERNGNKTGCHVDGVCVNNISYANDMNGAMKKLLKICEEYVVAHRLRYNTKKSAWCVL